MKRQILILVTFLLIMCFCLSSCDIFPSPETKAPITTVAAETTLEATDEDVTTGAPVTTAAPVTTTAPVTTEAPTTPAHTHSYVPKVTKKATCGEAGVTTYTCSCGASYTEPIPATGLHSFDAGTVTTDPTCVKTGVKTYTCGVCKQTKTETVPATGLHSYDAGTITTDPTCVKTGVKTYTCGVCKQTKTETVPATGLHSYDAGTVTTDPTCVKTGVKTYTCGVCKQTKTETVPATGKHIYGAGYITKSASCEEPGEMTYTCTVCFGTKTEPISATGHQMDGHYCSVCSYRDLPVSEGLSYVKAGEGYVVEGRGTSYDREIVIPDTYNGLPVYGIGHKAFMGDKDLTAVYFPKSLTVVFKSAFEDCANLTTVCFAKSSCVIGDRSFFRCVSLSDLDLGYGVFYIGSKAFQFCTGLTQVAIPDSVTEMGTGVFMGCFYLETAKLSGNLAALPEDTFFYCRALNSLTITKNTLSIGKWAFDGCTNLSTVMYSGSATQWNDIEIGKQADYVGGIDQTNAILYSVNPLTNVNMGVQDPYKGMSHVCRFDSGSTITRFETDSEKLGSAYLATRCSVDGCLCMEGSSIQSKVLIGLDFDTNATTFQQYICSGEVIGAVEFVKSGTNVSSGTIADGVFTAGGARTFIKDGSSVNKCSNVRVSFDFVTKAFADGRNLMVGFGGYSQNDATVFMFQLGVTKNGKLTYYKNTTEAATESAKLDSVTLTAGKWYHMDMDIDFVNTQVTIYLGEWNGTRTEMTTYETVGTCSGFSSISASRDEFCFSLINSSSCIKSIDNFFVFE